MKFGRLVWGLIILIAGALLLGVNFGWWSPDIFLRLASLWPVLIILIGLSIILGHDNPILIVLTLIIILLSVILVIGKGNFIDGRFFESGNVQTTSDIFNLPIIKELSKATFNVDVGAAELKIDKTDQKDTLFNGNYTLSSFLSPDKGMVVNYTDSEANIKISEDLKAGPFFRQSSSRRILNLGITDRFPLDINIATGASKLDLDLSQLKVRDLSVDAGASSADIRFGTNESNVKASLDMGASSIRLRIPKDTGIKITLDGALISNNFDAMNLSRSENKNYSSSGFESAINKITLAVKAGASSITLERY